MQRESAWQKGKNVEEQIQILEDDIVMLDSLMKQRKAQIDDKTSETGILEDPQHKEYQKMKDRSQKDIEDLKKNLQ
jgi:GR25 family glycosyltransferase involved in LPS biosynthesis